MRIDLSRIVTNPVWWLNYRWNEDFHGGNAANPIEFLKRVTTKLNELHVENGISFPRNPNVHSQIDFGDIPLGKKRAGSIGLMVKGDTGFVTELTAKKSANWSVARNLPFREEHAIDALYQVLNHCSIGNFVPLLQGFEVRDSLGERADGGSMDISCLMAIIDSVYEQQIPLLDFVCSVVQPAPDGKLEPVGGVGAKLSAFAREYDTGTLLIYHPSSTDEVTEYLPMFESTGGAWPVESYEQLATYLQQADLVAKLISSHSLTFASIRAIERQVRFLEKNESRLGDALELVNRAMDCIDDSTPLRTRLALVHAAGDLHRHSGSFSQAINLSEQYLTGDHDELASYEDLLTRDYRLSAAYYDAHRFTDSKALLSPWLDKVIGDPKIVAVESLPKLFNSQARNLAALGDNGWEELFEESLEIQAGLNHPDIARTRNYLIKCHLKDNNLDKADVEIRKNEALELDKNSTDHLKFLKAELARQRQQKWPKEMPAIECASEHALAFFFQAYARQPHPREFSERVLKIGAESLKVEVDNGSLNIRQFLSGCCYLAAGIYGSNQMEVESGLAMIDDFMGHAEANAIRAHYRDEIEKLRKEPTIGSLNKLFERIPHF